MRIYECVSASLQVWDAVEDARLTKEVANGSGIGCSAVADSSTP